jgi:hypothetical protein
MNYDALKMASQASQRRACGACEGPESKELQRARGYLRRLRSDFSKMGLRNSLFSGPSQGRRLRTPIGGPVSANLPALGAAAWGRCEPKNGLTSI